MATQIIFEKLAKQSRLPVMAAPLFIISVPKLVIAQCKTGIIGSFPALNARDNGNTEPLLEKWLKEITEELDKYNQKNPDRPKKMGVPEKLANEFNLNYDPLLGISGY